MRHSAELRSGFCSSCTAGSCRYLKHGEEPHGKVKYELAGAKMQQVMGMSG